jgi:hypothetical protein
MHSSRFWQVLMLIWWFEATADDYEATPGCVPTLHSVTALCFPVELHKPVTFSSVVRHKEVEEEQQSLLQSADTCHSSAELQNCFGMHSSVRTEAKILEVPAGNTAATASRLAIR